MAGGYGRARWGAGPWGGADQDQQQAPAGSPFAGGLYPVPAGHLFGRARVSAFTGEPGSGPLSGASGLIFFSAALLEESSANSLDLSDLRVSAFAGDEYYRPEERSSRVFRFGGGPGFGASNPSRTNDTLYRTQPSHYTAVATLVQTIPPGPTTYVKIP